MNWEIGNDVNSLLIPCIKWVTTESLLYSTGNYAQEFVGTEMGKKSKKERICVNIWLIHFAVQWRLTAL